MRGFLGLDCCQLFGLFCSGSILSNEWKNVLLVIFKLVKIKGSYGEKKYFIFLWSKERSGFSDLQGNCECLAKIFKFARNRDWPQMSLLTGLERNMKCYKKEFDENADSSSLVWDRMFMFIICKRIRSIFLKRKKYIRRCNCKHRRTSIIHCFINRYLIKMQILMKCTCCVSMSGWVWGYIDWDWKLFVLLSCYQLMAWSFTTPGKHVMITDLKTLLPGVPVTIPHNVVNFWDFESKQ